jgi:uncharacterized protein YpmS
LIKNISKSNLFQWKWLHIIIIGFMINLLTLFFMLLLVYMILYVITTTVERFDFEKNLNLTIF